MHEAFEITKKYVSGTELRNNGLSYYKISKLVEAGKLKKINHTTYENLLYNGEEHDFFMASAYVPEGTICLLSAARYYNLTTYIPDSIDVAIDRKARVSTLPDSPEIKLYYFNPGRMEIGNTTVDEEGNRFAIFDIEKTVVDIIYYRNKVGIEETGEIVRNYIKRPDRDLNRLYEYAKNLAVKKRSGHIWRCFCEC